MSTMTPSAPITPVGELQTKWGWFVALGIALFAIGLYASANLYLATFASILYVSAMMLVGGAMEIIHAFNVKTWGRFFFWLASGLLYLAAGVIAFMNPLLAKAVLTLTLAILLVASGISRIIAGIGGRYPGAGVWLVISGIITLVAGVVIAAGWPTNSLWVLGLLLAVDLMFQGIANFAFGLGLRAR
jgi:uncharacterized membrane protein HdeD (DUF308 family)